MLFNASRPLFLSISFISLIVNIQYQKFIISLCLTGGDNNQAYISLIAENVKISESCFHSKHEQTTLKNVHHSSNVINSFPHCMSAFTAQCSSQHINELNYVNTRLCIQHVRRLFIPFNPTPMVQSCSQPVSLTYFQITFVNNIYPILYLHATSWCITRHWTINQPSITGYI